MAKGFKRGGYGLPLNFKVVGNPQPTNPKENTLWLNTDEKITSYYFQEEQPANMKQGEVFVTTGTQSPINFNALKKNGITVYPLKAQQMVSGTLKDIEAKIYQNGEWVRWTYLLDLDAINWNVESTSRFTHGLSNNNGALTFSAKNNVDNEYTRASAYHKTLIDVSAYNSLEVTCSWNNCVGYNGSLPCYVGLYNKNLQEVAIIGSSSALSTSKLDISNLAGEYYFFVNVSMAGGASVSATIEKIELL